MVYYGFSSIGDVLNTWADLGVFAYALPFLLIFAIVFGILTKSKILGENKGVQATVALAVGLLALQFNYVTSFYEIIFPYAGVGLAILLIGIIFMGFIIDPNDKSSKIKYVLFGLGVIVFLYIVFGSLTDFTWFGGLGYSFGYAWPTILAGLILLGLLALIVWGDRLSGGRRAGE